MSVKMDICENMSIADSLGKIVDLNDLFSMNNIIIFVVLMAVLLVVGIKMKLLPPALMDKIPFLKEKKQVEFAEESESAADETDNEKE
jgi:hypothetical protein